jgi:hypothetical protein
MEKLGSEINIPDPQHCVTVTNSCSSYLYFRTEADVNRMFLLHFYKDFYTKNGDLLVVAVAVAYVATGPTSAVAVPAVFAVVDVEAAPVVKNSVLFCF